MDWIYILKLAYVCVYFCSPGLRTGVRYSLQFLKSAHLLQWNGQIKPWDGNAHYVELWEKYYIPDPLGEFSLVRKFGN